MSQSKHALVRKHARKHARTRTQEQADTTTCTAHAQALAILDAPVDDDGIGDAWREPDHATEES